MIINNGERKFNNKEMCDKAYLTLCALRDGKGAKNEDEKREMLKQYYKILNGSQNAEQIMSYLKQIYDEKDTQKALQLINDSLIPYYESEEDPRYIEAMEAQRKAREAKNKK